MEGSRIKRIRSKMGLSQLRMAQVVGEAVGRSYSKGAFADWERERYNPPKDVQAFLEAIEQDDGSFAVTDPDSQLKVEGLSGDSSPTPDGPKLADVPLPTLAGGMYAKICEELFDLIATGTGMVGAVLGNANLMADGLIIHGDKHELGVAWGRLAETNETFRKMLVSSEKQGAYLAIALATGTTAGKIWRQHATTNFDLETSADVLNLVTSPPDDAAGTL